MRTTPGGVVAHTRGSNAADGDESFLESPPLPSVANAAVAMCRFASR
jgi:hypothetical protein